MVIAHGGFICNMLYSSGLKKLPVPGTIIGIELNKLSQKDLLSNNLLNDYKTYYKNEKDNNEILHEYNTKFDEFLSKAIKSIDFITELPDLQEEFL